MRLNDNTNIIEFKDVVNLRLILFRNFYNNEEAINNLASLISKYIECLSIDYDTTTCSYTIKIKKTAMKKSSGFNHCPEFYYNCVSSIFYEFIKNNESIIKNELKQHVQSPSEFLNNIYNCREYLYNLCSITCISDNVIMFKL